MSVRSIDRAMQILHSFTVEEPLLGVTDLSRKLGIHQSTVHHLVKSLAKWGLLEQDSHSKKYRLGLRTIELGGTMLQSRNLAQVVLPYLHHVADKLQETAYLGVLVDDELLNLEQICGPHLIQHVGWQGRRTPFYCTSAGKVLAAHLLPEEQGRLILETKLVAFTPNTITDPDDLRRELQQIREQGYAINLGELEEHNNAVAVPIRGQGNTQVVAALGVVGPAYRFTQTHCRNAATFMKSVAQDISSKIQAGDFSSELVGVKTPSVDLS